MLNTRAQFMGVTRWFFILSYCAVALVISSQVVSANFICGSVNSEDTLSPSWFEVTVYYSENPLQTTSCLVSPQDNKYCCDPREIESVSWNVGKDITAEIFDPATGYFSTPQTTFISGEGYDVLEPLELTQAITLHSPEAHAFLDTTSLDVSVSLAEPYSVLLYELIGPQGTVSETVCEACSQSTFTLEDLSYGAYSLVLTAYPQGQPEKMLSKEHSFTLLEYVEVNRTLVCDGCTSDFAPPGTDVLVQLDITLSHPVEGIVYDAFPTEWEYTGDGVVVPFSDTHTAVQLAVNGAQATMTYPLQSPSNRAPAVYAFQSGFESFEVTIHEVLVFYFRLPWFLTTASWHPSLVTFGISDVLSFTQKEANLEESITPDYSERVSRVGPLTPLVLSLEGDYPVQQVALFTSEPHGFSEAQIIFRDDASFSYPIMDIYSTLPKSAIENVFIRYVPPEESATLFFYDSQEGVWIALESTFNPESGAYEALAPTVGSFVFKTDLQNSESGFSLLAFIKGLFS